jgi:hypothetical protein
MYLTGVSGQLSRQEYVAWLNFILNTHLTKLDGATQLQPDAAESADVTRSRAGALQT